LKPDRKDTQPDREQQERHYDQPAGNTRRLDSRCRRRPAGRHLVGMLRVSGHRRRFSG
jgi:hypothetical protein